MSARYNYSEQMSFEFAKKLMSKCRKGEKRLSGRSTVLYKVDDSAFAIRYHDTDVVTIHDDGSFTLFTGGHRTVTTKARINEYSPARISQKDFSWYLDGKDFKSGCRVDSKGHLIENLQDYHQKTGYNGEQYATPLLGSRSPVLR